MAIPKFYPPITIVSGILSGTATAVGGATANTGNWRTGAAPVEVQNQFTDNIGRINFHVIALGGETIKFQGSLDGTNWNDVTPFDATGKAASLTLATGNYYVDSSDPYYVFRFVKSAGVQVGTVAWAAAGVSTFE